MVVLTPRNEYLGDACEIPACLDRFLEDGVKGETPSPSFPGRPAGAIVIE
jgi:hypothetical protein